MQDQYYHGNVYKNIQYILAYKKLNITSSFIVEDARYHIKTK